MAKKTESKPAVNQPKLKQRPVTTIIWILGVVMVVLLLTIIGSFVYEYTYQNKVYPGIYFNRTSLSGQTYAEISNQVHYLKTTIEQPGLVFHFKNDDLTIPITTADDTVPLLTINPDDTATLAYGIGRSATAVNNIYTKLQRFITPTTVKLQYTLNREALLVQLQNKFDQYTTPYHNAGITFAEDGTSTITTHSDGTKFDWDTILAEIDTALQMAQPVNITLDTIIDPAPITKTIATERKKNAEAIYASAPLTLHYNDQNFTISATDIGVWLIFTPTGVGFNHLAMTESLQTIAEQVDQPTKEGKFSLNIVDGKVELTQFQDGQDGLGIAIDKTIAAIEKSVFMDDNFDVNLVVEIIHPRANPDNLDDLGITELLAIGETSFAGSPSNRVYNIKKGAELLNGLLLAPDETFSLLSILSPIDEAHGWKPELVIKGKKLEKEAGGGLCQVGTTAFRAAMLSGLPIVERHNHSWAVSYYSYNGKAGVDATIYEPSPDFKFKNDTGHYILWRSRVEGSKIMFEFWGTNDGRKGSFTEPSNYNYVSPGPTVETLDPSLPPGTRNCDNHVFTGVTASFDYIVEQADGTIDQQNFISVYKPQAASCVVGPSKAEESPKTKDTTANDKAGNASNDKTNINTNTNKNNNPNKNKTST